MFLNVFTFCIQENEKFVIWKENFDDVIHCCYQSYVILYLGKQEVIIGKSIIADFARELKEKLILGLENRLKLDSSIQKNIGYYWNQDLNESDPEYFLKQSDNGGWVGLRHLLWTTDSNRKYESYGTWLYNDRQGNIIFEVTPTYPDTFIDPEDPADVQAYQEWMENFYQPFFTRIISKEIAFQWLDQAEQILQLIKDNVKMLEENESNREQGA